MYNIPKAVQSTPSEEILFEVKGMALYTQQLLAETLKALMREKKLDSITVQELVDRAKVNRKTFYYHFHGISDLVNWLYAAELSRLIDTTEISPVTWTDLFLRIISRIREESTYLRAIIDSGYGPEFRLSMSRYFDRMLTKFVSAAMGIYEQEHNITLKLTHMQVNFIIRYYSMAFYAIVEEWLLKGLKESESDFVNIMIHLSNDNMYHSFASMHEENMRRGRPDN